MSTHDFEFIRKVNQLAWKSASLGFGPFAALLVYENRLMDSSMDACIPLADPTAHAEISVIRKHCQDQHLISLEGYTLYASTEPCIMCSGAIHWAKISRVVFSVSQSMLQKKSGGNQKLGSETLVNIGGLKMEVSGPILAEEGKLVYQSFPFRSKKELFQAYHQKK